MQVQHNITSSITNEGAGGSDKRSDVKTDSSARIDGDRNNDSDGADPESGLQDSPAAAIVCLLLAHIFIPLT